VPSLIRRRSLNRVPLRMTVEGVDDRVVLHILFNIAERLADFK